MKGFKIMSIVLMLCLVTVLFTGCFSTDGSIKINADGSTSVSVFVGYTKEYIRMAVPVSDGETYENVTCQGMVGEEIEDHIFLFKK